jgi:hypothetical protein
MAKNNLPERVPTLEQIEKRFDALDAAMDAIRDDLAAFTKLLTDLLRREG